MPTPADHPGQLPEAVPFPAGFGSFDRPAPVLPDPTVAPPELGAPEVGRTTAGPPQAVPSPAPEPVAPPQRYLPPPPPVAPQRRAGAAKLPIWTVIGVIAAIVGVLVPVLSSLRDLDRADQVNEGIDGFDDIGGSTEPLAADELYREESYTFRIELTDRVMEGELNLVEAYDHPDCVAAAANQDAQRALAGCRSRIEAVYTGADDGLRVSQQVLMFEDEASAETFGGLTADEFAVHVLVFEDPGDVDGSAYAASRSGIEGQYVVVTLMVSDSGDEQAVTAAEDHGHARHAESLSYLIWR